MVETFDEEELLDIVVAAAAETEESGTNDKELQACSHFCTISRLLYLATHRRDGERTEYV